MKKKDIVTLLVFVGIFVFLTLGGGIFLLGNLVLSILGGILNVIGALLLGLFSLPMNVFLFVVGLLIIGAWFINLFR